MPDRTPFGIAVVGAGVGRAHVLALRDMPDSFRLIAVCDLDADKARAAAGEIDGCRAITGFDEILADPSTDIVALCTPPTIHAEQAIAALEAGKTVMCEKPIATSLRDAERMVAAAERSQGLLVPVFQYRYGRGFRQLQAMIRQGLAGRPLAATLETHWNRGADYYAVDWRGSWKGEGGGAILSHAIHIHDLMMEAFGPVACVSAQLATNVNPIEVEDSAAISFRLASGAVVASSVTLGAADDSSRLRFCFERLTAESVRNPYHPAAAPWTFIARAPADQAAVDAAAAAVPPFAESYAGLYGDLDRALRGEPSDLVAPADGVRSIELAAAIYASAAAGLQTDLPLDRDSAYHSSNKPQEGPAPTGR